MFVIWLSTEVGVQVPGHRHCCVKGVISASCLQCFDAVGWVAGRASGL